MNIPQLGEALSPEHVHFLQVFRKSCSQTILKMLRQSQSGHPGGSLSSLDFLVLLYTFIISQTGEKLIISNGHISPAIYSILSELAYIPKQEVIDTFRQVGSIYEGHITRHVPGVIYGTGPLGAGVSAASGFALAEQIKKENNTVYAVIGDGEAQEGQVMEMMHFVNKYQLNNFVLLVDYNQVQLSASLNDVMPIDISGLFKTANWNVIEVDGHNFSDLWSSLYSADQSDRPTIIVAKTLMGKGVGFMEPEGLEYRPTWHGKAPKPDQIDEALPLLDLSTEEKALLDLFRQGVRWQPKKPFLNESQSDSINVGNATVLSVDTMTDCRSAYGNALLDLAKKNQQIIALTADLGGSVKTDIMKKSYPERVFDVGIAEQQMVSVSGGLSLSGFVPFCSTFGAFMTSRAKDQARVNDINRTNVKMVSTHCGLSVGEDGPTHQAIDDMGSFLGLFNTTILEPADPNLCDHMIRYAAKTYGNMYIRMGRAKISILTKEDGTPFYDESYRFQPGKSDVLRLGEDITLLAAGPMVEKALAVQSKLSKQFSIELITLTSLSHLDKETLIRSAQKTKRIITIEDHNPHSGYARAVAALIANNQLSVKIKHLAVESYQLSGKAEDLYASVGLDEAGIESAVRELMTT